MVNWGIQRPFSPTVLQSTSAFAAAMCIKLYHTDYRQHGGLDRNGVNAKAVELHLLSLTACLVAHSGAGFTLSKGSLYFFFFPLKSGIAFFLPINTTPYIIYAILHACAYLIISLKF